MDPGCYSALELGRVKERSSLIGVRVQREGTEALEVARKSWSDRDE